MDHRELRVCHNICDNISVIYTKQTITLLNQMRDFKMYACVFIFYYR